MLLEAIAIIISSVLLYYVLGLLREPSNLPPGPRPLPIIGNFLDIADTIKSVHIGFMKLSKKYGSVFTVYLEGKRTVVINSISAMRELFITRKDDFAGRPFVFTGDYLTMGSNDVAFQDFSPALVLQRKLLHTAIRRYSTQLVDTVTFEVDALIERFKANGATAFEPKDDFEFVVMNVMCAIVFGERYEQQDQEFLDTVYFIDKTFELLGSVSIMNMFPWLIYFPYKTSRELKEVRKMKDQMLTRKYIEHRDTFTEGQIRDLTDALLQAKLDEEREENNAAQLITETHVIMNMQSAFLGGIDTTVAGIMWAIAYLISHPEIQAKVHAELDDVVGRERQPVAEDKKKLPYLEAVIVETLRLSPLLTILLPHKALKDSTIEGYSIPKDTVVLLNMYAANHDKKVWKNPDDFDPMRFLDAEGTCTAKDCKTMMPFGAGRCGCPGESLARVELFLIISRLMQQFEFTSPPGSPPPDLAGTIGLVSKPSSYKVCCRDRLAKQ